MEHLFCLTVPYSTLYLLLCNEKFHTTFYVFRTHSLKLFFWWNPINCVNSPVHEYSTCFRMLSPWTACSSDCTAARNCTDSWVMTANPSGPIVCPPFITTHASNAVYFFNHMGAFVIAVDAAFGPNLSPTVNRVVPSHSVVAEEFSNEMRATGGMSSRCSDVC